MFLPFGAKHLLEVDRSDLDALINDQVPEGLFVEYKSEWTSHKVARAVASFANSPGGGWLIVGIEAAGLLPKAIAALDDNGDLEDRVVQTVRSSVTPVPSFAPRAIETEPGKAGLVVHVPEGTQPPYILIRTGQVLVRTPTSSEPVGINDREALDRLFARGERGSIWARKFADGLRASARDDWSARVWTTPAVDEGLAAIAATFYRSFAQAVVDQMETFGWVSSASFEQRARQDMDEDLMTMSILTVEGDDSLLRMSVRGSGVIGSIWTRPRQGTDAQALKGLLRWALPSHARLYEERLSHPGFVGVAVSAHWNTGDHQPSLVFVPRVPVRLEELSGEALHDSLDRSIDRSQGYLTPEPES